MDDCLHSAIGKSGDISFILPQLPMLDSSPNTLQSNAACH